MLRRLEREAPRRARALPHYEKEFSAPVRMYLAGEFGAEPEDVNPFAASAFYAVDRFASFKTDWGGFYRAGGVVVADRYTTSNAIHQASKLGGEKREAVFRWLYDFEFERLGLPFSRTVISSTCRRPFLPAHGTAEQDHRARPRRISMKKPRIPSQSTRPRPPRRLLRVDEDFPRGRGRGAALPRRHRRGGLGRRRKGHPKIN
jgi:hypothetical protein